MLVEHFQLNEATLAVVEQIGSHMPGGFFLCRAEKPEELLYANHAVLNIYGCSSLDEFRELTGFTFRGMVHPEDYAALPFPEDPGDGKEDSRAEYRILRRDGDRMER